MTQRKAVQEVKAAEAKLREAMRKAGEARKRRHVALSVLIAKRGKP